MMDMATMARHECAVYPSEKRFAAWLKAVEALIGGSVDQNGQAYDLFADEATPEEAAAELRAS